MRRLGRYGALFGLLLATCPCAFALNPALDVSQYAHTGWKFRDGFAKSEISAIVQTFDGYLWLGTGSGLFLFDGVKAVPWEPPADQPLPSRFIYSLVAARDGTLWIGTRNGLASWKNGKLTQYAELAGFQIFRLLEDQEGSIWAGAYGLPEGKLCEVQKGSVRCYPKPGGLGRGVFGLHEDRKGNLWVGLTTGVWRWKPGLPQFYALPVEFNGVQGIADDDDGAALVATGGGIRRLIGGTSPLAFPFPASIRGSARRILRDRDGGLWVGTRTAGLVHLHQGRTDLFSQSDGLTANTVGAFYEDREGNIWAATLNGLDRFRELPVVTYSTNQGVSSVPSAVLGAKDGAVWFDVGDGLSRLHQSQVTTYRQRPGRSKAGVREIAVSGLPERNLGSIFPDSRGRIWVSSLAGVGYLENDRYISTAAPAGFVVGFTEDTAGNLWIAYQDRGLVRLSLRNEIQQISWETFGRKDPAQPLADPVQGGLWLGFRNGGVAYFRDGQIRASYTGSDGLAAGQVNQLRFDASGALWVATAGGLSRLKNGRVAKLTSKSGLPCDEVHWTLEDDDRSIWLGMSCGLVRVEHSSLDASFASENADRKIQATVFDITEGVRMPARVGGIKPHAGKSTDGRLWFITLDGLSSVDARHLPFNKLPPPVQIEKVIADRKQYPLTAGLRLPALIRDLQIDYTALSFVAPEKVRFRFKLEGHDSDWTDAGNRRQAFYNDLRPRHYRFRVMASNNDGMWNQAGASLDFSVDPAYYQTAWFLASCVAVSLALLAALYYVRIEYVKRQFHVRLEARVEERTRIARDFHDTTLQSFQGVLLNLGVIPYLMGDQLPQAREKLEGIIEQGRQAVTEGRDAVQGLRSSTVVTNDLVRAITTHGQQLTADHGGPDCPEFHVRAQGESRDLAPLVRDEVHRIGCEAIRNAFQHAQAREISVEIQYNDRQFRLRIRDNGKGMDSKVLADGGRAGHHGLPGMKERAQLAGGKLTVSSRPDSGTEIDLTIPASFAYTKSPRADESGSSSKGG